MTTEMWFGVSIAGNLILGLLLVGLWSWYRTVVQENKILIDIFERISQAGKEEQNRARSQEKERRAAIESEIRNEENHIIVDHQTYSLVWLATNNPNDNEARTAAVQACMRISKHLKPRIFLLTRGRG